MGKPQQIMGIFGAQLQWLQRQVRCGQWCAVPTTQVLAHLHRRCRACQSCHHGTHWTPKRLPPRLSWCILQLGGHSLLQGSRQAGVQLVAAPCALVVMDHLPNAGLSEQHLEGGDHIAAAGAAAAPLTAATLTLQGHTGAQLPCCCHVAIMCRHQRLRSGSPIYQNNTAHMTQRLPQSSTCTTLMRGG